jgi:Leucine-rich repeat (LRR) protein
VSFSPLQDAIGLTSVNITAALMRFETPNIQHFHFDSPREIFQFLANGTGRTAEELSHIHTLSLRLPNDMHPSLGANLFAALPAVTTLNIELTGNANRPLLENLLNSARPLQLTQLTLAAADDSLPSNLWALPNLEHLTLNMPNVEEISEEIGGLSALTHLTLGDMPSLVSLPDALTSLAQDHHLQSITLIDMAEYDISQELETLIKYTTTPPKE